MCQGRPTFLSMYILGVLSLLVSNRGMSQNTFPITGSVGITTTSPLMSKAAEGKLCRQRHFVTCDERGKAAPQTKAGGIR